jgi:hypothetical protein
MSWFKYTILSAYFVSIISAIDTVLSRCVSVACIIWGSYVSISVVNSFFFLLASQASTINCHQFDVIVISSPGW